MAQVDTSAQHGSSDDGDDWSAVQDPNTRRKIQNRLAQRKFREKARLQREEAERAAVNQYRASGAYVAPTPDEVDTGSETGLPWGSLSFRQAVAAGTVKEQSSRETSIYAAASRTGGSSRLGLRLDHYARGLPAWAAWRLQAGDPSDAQLCAQQSRERPRDS